MGHLAMRAAFYHDISARCDERDERLSDRAATSPGDSPADALDIALSMT
jgi:hypothetical protein